MAALCLATATGVAQADDIDSVQRLAAAGQSTAALASLERLLVARPRDPALRFLKGVLLSDAQRSADATQVFERLTEDYPELPEPYNNLAVLYAAQGDYERARVALGAALRANPRYAVAQANLGDVHLQLAQLSYQRALGIEPKDGATTVKLDALRRLNDAALRTAPP